MNNPALQSALREWRTHMTTPARAVGILGTAAILTLMGPFSTAEVMRALPRLGYWLVLVGLSYSAGFAANGLAQRLAPASLLQRIAIAGAVTGAAVLALVYVLNGLTLGFWAQGRDAVILAGNVLGISVIISAIFQVAYDAPDTTASAPVAILDRLPFDKRGPLVSMTVEDHYVRVRTTNGEELVLMRLSDAIREVGDTTGAQVHRSHWVAWSAVTAARRAGDRAILTLADHTEIPVSRANVPKLKDAGLMPK